jgi:hypothetical protein
LPLKSSGRTRCKVPGTTSHPVTAISRFAYSFLFGMGAIASTRVKGIGRRLLLLAPALAIMILSETIVPRLAAASSHSTGPFLCGAFFGFFLMFSAFNPLRERV